MGDLSNTNLPAICNICDYIAKEFKRYNSSFHVDTDFKTNEHCEINGADLIIWNHLFKKSFLMKIRDDLHLWVWLRRRAPDCNTFCYPNREDLLKVIEIELCDPKSFDKIFTAIVHQTELVNKKFGGFRRLEDVNEIL
jgi:hypothetical protein